MDGVVEYIKSDLYRYSGNVSFGSFVKQYVRSRSFKYSFWLRLCKSQNGMIRLIAMIMHKWYSGKYLIKIPRATRIGYGLYIGHDMCIVISDTAVIGDNCNISQFLTIGSNHEKAATIGDCVYIGPNVCIVEDVAIGSGATIGAGSVVVKDVQENSTVAGSPARTISMKAPGRYIVNRWIRP